MNSHIHMCVYVSMYVYVHVGKHLWKHGAAIWPKLRSFNSIQLKTKLNFLCTYDLHKLCCMPQVVQVLHCTLQCQCQHVFSICWFRFDFNWSNVSLLPHAFISTSVCQNFTHWNTTNIHTHTTHLTLIVAHIGRRVIPQFLRIFSFVAHSTEN